MPESYVRRRGEYQLKCEKQLHMRVRVKMAILSSTYFMHLYDKGNIIHLYDKGRIVLQKSQEKMLYSITVLP